MPSAGALLDPAKRAVAHHILANHELQALEVMASVLLAFPLEPREFRLGMARIMEDEQRHTRWHAQRVAELGGRFGDLPVNGYIWTKSRQFRGALDYLIKQTEACALRPSFRECTIRKASVGKRHGAVAAIVEQLTLRSPSVDRARLEERARSSTS